MADKKNKDEKKPRFQVKKREPKEKPNYFQNIPSMKHPLAEILDFPLHSPINLDSQTSESRLSNDKESGYPKEEILDSQITDQRIAKYNKGGYPNNKTLDSQNTEQQIAKTKPLGYPNTEILDSQENNSGYPKKTDLDSQTGNTEQPDAKSLDIQIKKEGYPKGKFLDSKISKEQKRISKNEPSLDSKISKSNFLDIQKAEETGKWEKYDRKRKGKGIFLRTGEEITKKFKQFCIENDWDFSHGTEIAWNKIMTDLDSQSKEGLDSLIALDDRRMKMLYKSKSLIINLYLTYNTIFNEFAGGKSKWKPRWTPRDDEAGQKFNDADISLIELGIIQTQINKGIGQGRIQTFKYYTDEIENFLQAEISPETARTILEVNRKMWKNQMNGKEIDLKFLDQKIELK